MCVKCVYYRCKAMTPKRKQRGLKMKNEIKIFWNGVKLNGELQKMNLSFDKIDDKIFFYCDYSAEMPKECGVVVENNSDSQTDYFEKDHGSIAPEHPLYKFFRHAAIVARVRLCKAEIRQFERWAKKWHNDYSTEIERWSKELEKFENLEKESNPGQPTAEDFANVENYTAEKKAQAEAARKAKEEEEDKARMMARQNTIAKVNATVEKATKSNPIVEGKPFVVIPFSEMWGLPNMNGEKLTLSVKAADEILGELDTWQHEIREKGFYGWYHKTDFDIYYKDENGDEGHYNGRYDIGDGEGGLLNHIRNFGEWHRTHEEFGKVRENPPKTNEILDFVKMLENAA